MALDKKELLDALWSRPASYSSEEDSRSSFAGGGEISGARHDLPRSLFVEGAGEVCLPLSASDAAALTRISEQAPYGRGSDTLLDPLVRRAHQIDASLLSPHPRNSPFLSSTVQSIAADAIAMLGMDARALSLQAKLYKLLLYDAGGHFQLHRDTEKEVGMFATLIIQLPSSSPHLGGHLVVLHRQSKITFDFSGRDCASRFYFMVFFADCQHMLSPIATGTRACLVFNLIRQNASVAPVVDVPGLLESVSRTEAALRGWLEDYESGKGPQKLFIPLEHKYTKANLCFAGLKGTDRIVGEILRRCTDSISSEPSLELHLHSNDSSSGEPCLELHLCILTKHILSEGDGDYEEENFSTENWMGRDDQPVSLSNMKIDISSELVASEDDLFGELVKPDRKEHEEHMGNYGPSTQYWYHRGMLVIWPKKSSVRIACSGGFLGALDIVEAKLKDGASPEVVLQVRELLDFCVEDPLKVWETSPRWDSKHGIHGKITCRLMTLILESGGECGDVLRFIDILANNQEAPSYCQYDFSIHTRANYKGIASMEVAKLLALAVKAHGWDACGKAIEERLLCASNVLSQCEYYANLALELQAMELHDAALSIARKSHTLVCNSSKCSSSEWLIAVPGAVAMTKMLFALPECHTDLVPSFLSLLAKQAATSTVCAVVAQLKDWNFAYADEDDPSKNKTMQVKDVPRLLPLIMTLCHELTSRDFHSDSQKSPQKSWLCQEPQCTVGVGTFIEDVMGTFLWLSDGSLLEALVQALVQRSQKSENQKLLRQVTHSSRFWQEASMTDMGRKAMVELVQERIRTLASQPKPVFNWCQPSANLPNHLAVESFLRGPKETFTYCGTFKNLPHARNFTHKYFGYGANGSHTNGYSATGREGGRGAASYCKIRKTRHAFDNLVKQWQADQEELANLRSRIRDIPDFEKLTSKRGFESILSDIDVSLASASASAELNSASKKLRGQEGTQVIELD